MKRKTKKEMIAERCLSALRLAASEMRENLSMLHAMGYMEVQEDDGDERFLYQTWQWMLFLGLNRLSPGASEREDSEFLLSDLLRYSIETSIPSVHLQGCSILRTDNGLNFCISGEVRDEDGLRRLHENLVESLNRTTKHKQRKKSNHSCRTY